MNIIIIGFVIGYLILIFGIFKLWIHNQNIQKKLQEKTEEYLSAKEKNKKPPCGSGCTSCKKPAKPLM